MPGPKPRGLRGPDTKNQGQNQQIKMKFFVSHYSHKSMPDAKFESGSFYSFGDITSKMSLSRRKLVVEVGYLPPENMFNLKIISFYVQIRSF